MKPLTPQQVKVAWIVAAVLVFVHFAPSILGTLLQTIALHRMRAVAANARPAPLPVPLPVNLVVAPAAPSGPAFPLEAQARFLGVWDGAQMGNNNCQVHLELRPSPYKAGYIAGYETRICYDLAKLVTSRSDRGGLADALRAKSPLATKLEGTYSDGDLTFRVVDSIGGSEFTCSLSSYSILPWGAQDAIAQWKAVGGCLDGQMILKHGRG